MRGVNKTPYGALSVDTFYYLNSFSGEFQADSGGNISQIILTPSSGKKLVIFITHMVTDSASGEIALKFATSNKLVAKFYPIRFSRTGMIYNKVEGAIDEALTLEATDLDPLSKVFVVVLYKEV